MTQIKLTTIGNSVGAVLPKEVLEKMHVQKGDYLYLIEDENGFRMTPYNEELINQVLHGEAIMQEDRDLLKVLSS